MSKRSTASRKRLLLGVCAALVWTEASCRDVAADRGYCLACGGNDSDVNASVGAAGDGTAGSSQPAAVSGSGGASSGSVSASTTSGASSTAGGGAAGTSTSMVSTRPPAANGGGAGAGGMSMPGSSTPGSGGRGGAAASSGGRNAEPPIAGAATSEPCGGGCGGDKPVCDVQADQCRQCTPDDTHACPSEKRACDLLRHECVACVDDSTCPSDKPICDIGNQVCVACDRDRIGACGGSTPVCNPQQHKCVECSQDDPMTCGTRACDTSKEVCVDCMTPEQCVTRDKPRCERNACVGCQSDNDCARLSATPICDMASKQCELCSGGRGCGSGFVCNESSHTCMDTGTHALALCHTCTSDGDCPMGASCIAYTGANGRAAGMACFAPKPANLACDTPPFTREITGTSTSGMRGQFCAPAVSCGTLDAVMMGAKCMQGSQDCGDPAVRDGTCTQAGTCTYRCMRANDCPSGTTCTSDGQCLHSSN